MSRLFWPYRIWWLLLDGVRLLIRAAVETRRNSLIWPAAMTIRWAYHLAIASPWAAIALAVVIATGPTRQGLSVAAVSCVLVEVVVLVLRLTRWSAVEWLWTLRRAITVHRKWPRGWGDYSGRTGQVQAATGAEPSTPVRWRPLVDHPRLSWLFTTTAPSTVEFIVGPPPDRTYQHLVEAAPAMAAKFSFVESIEVDYDSDRSSLAVLIVTFTRPTRGDRARPALELVPNPDSGERVA